MARRGGSACCLLWAAAITLHAAKPSHVDVGVNQPYTKTVVADRDMLHKPQAQPSPPLVAEVEPLMPASNGCQIFQGSNEPNYAVSTVIKSNSTILVVTS